ncbi:hypothetical protein Bca101_050411 [Brassica carinata]
MYQQVDDDQTYQRVQKVPGHYYCSTRRKLLPFTSLLRTKMVSGIEGVFFSTFSL